MVTVAVGFVAFGIGCFLGHANGKWKERERRRRAISAYLDAHDTLDN